MESYTARQLKRHIKIRDESLINIARIHKDLDDTHKRIRETEEAIANIVKEEKLYNEPETVDVQA